MTDNGSNGNGSLTPPGSGIPEEKMMLMLQDFVAGLTLREIAEKNGISYSYAMKISAHRKWGRFREGMKGFNEEALKATIERLAEDYLVAGTEKLLNFLSQITYEAGLAVMVKVRSGEISVADFEKLVKLQRLELGLITEKTGTENLNVSLFAEIGDLSLAELEASRERFRQAARDSQGQG